MSKPNRLPKLTTKAFEREHYGKPSGFANWAFQRSTTPRAHAEDRYGEIYWISETYAKAAREARIEMDDASYVALLP